MCHSVYGSATEGVAAVKRASEIVCEGDRGWHLRLQKTKTLMERLQRLTSETSKEKDKLLHQMRRNLWKRLAIETSEAREVGLQKMRLNLQQQLKLQWIERLVDSKRTSVSTRDWMLRRPMRRKKDFNST